MSDKAREAVERYLEALAEEIANGESVDIPGIAKVQVVLEEGKGYSIPLRHAAGISASADLRCQPPAV